MSGGLGLGLAIVRGLVEMHGGTVQAESDGLGKGATFTVFFPLATQAKQVGLQQSNKIAEQQTENLIKEKQMDLQDVRVLVVDDEASARIMEFLGQRRQTADC